MLENVSLGRPYTVASETSSAVFIPYEVNGRVALTTVATFLRNRVRAEMPFTVFYRQRGREEWYMLNKGEEIPGGSCLELGDEIDFRYPGTDISFHHILVDRKNRE